MGAYLSTTASSLAPATPGGIKMNGMEELGSTFNQHKKREDSIRLHLHLVRPPSQTPHHAFASHNRPPSGGAAPRCSTSRCVERQDGCRDRRTASYSHHEHVPWRGGRRPPVSADEAQRRHASLLRLSCESLSVCCSSSAREADLTASIAYLHPLFHVQVL